MGAGEEGRTMGNGMARQGRATGWEEKGEVRWLDMRRRERAGGLGGRVGGDFRWGGGYMEVNSDMEPSRFFKEPEAASWARGMDMGMVM